ncbi:uncharacterized protein PHACADRAFT_261337 [Phanerochaete carnosa HHB-10118-sp]|uniref:C2H2-type domain-containing protein n=1 Tax=Phanerochaete carnosa (strain HHB-10118-sp) TaxID=650164 RepID=K5W0W0_PHACS|nr:uncharacterized protein PHACADRAFT_261337 [Phanerochaete carnosa HHB-10118-sp]EKM52735.1 hypothetical protein PHACADRAFT_261337 [Phanerochaete carnosa HHB-10118-sp]
MSPSFNLTSFSLCDAYQQLICTPPQPQADIPPLQGFAQLSMHEYAVSPAALQISSHQVVVPVTPKSQFNSIPSTPETQFYSIPSTSSSGSSAWTTDSDPADSDFAPSPRPKRASGHTRKTARASPAAQRAPRTRQRFSPYSSAPSSPYSSESSSRAPAIKYTKRRTQQVDADSPVAEPETEGPRAYMCPLCEHHQTNRHLPDLRRHILTHYPHARKHVCRGVRHAAAPPGAVERFGVVEEDGGEERVGGCYQAFSRHDALLRHLRNTNVVCLYDAAELERRVGRRKAREAAPKAQARPCKDNGKGKAGLRKARQ